MKSFYLHADHFPAFIRILVGFFTLPRRYLEIAHSHCQPSVRAILLILSVFGVILCITSIRCLGL